MIPALAREPKRQAGQGSQPKGKSFQGKASHSIHPFDE
jgi:hypothetical protein